MERCFSMRNCFLLPDATNERSNYVTDVRSHYKSNGVPNLLPHEQPADFAPNGEPNHLPAHVGAHHQPNFQPHQRPSRFTADVPTHHLSYLAANAHAHGIPELEPNRRTHLQPNGVSTTYGSIRAAISSLLRDAVDYNV